MAVGGSGRGLRLTNNQEYPDSRRRQRDADDPATERAALVLQVDPESQSHKRNEDSQKQTGVLV